MSITDVLRTPFAFIKSLSEQATRLPTLVKPETLLRWQRQFLKNLWTYERKRRGRPHIKRSEKELILEMKQENHLWGCRRIADELQKLDIFVHYSKEWKNTNSKGGAGGRGSLPIREKPNPFISSNHSTLNYCKMNNQPKKEGVATHWPASPAYR